MIQRNIALAAPFDNTDYSLNFIGNNHNRVELEFLENTEEVIIWIGLCNEECISSDDQFFQETLDGNRRAQKAFSQIENPWIRRIVLEDGQTILAIQSTNQDQNMLLLEKHASFRNKKWQEIFHPIWEGEE